MDVVNVSILKGWIKSKTVPRFLLFTGPEVMMQKVYIKQIAKTYNLEIKYLDSIQNLGSGIRSQSFIKRSKLYVFRDCTEYQNEAAATLLHNSDALMNDYFVFIFTTLDKRTKWFKENEDCIINFDYMNTSILMKYVSHNIDLDEARLTTLIETCEHDFSRILLEVDKIRQYKAATPSCTFADAFDRLYEDGVIYRPPKDAVFDFVDAVLKHKTVQAMQLLDETYAGGEATLVILANLYNSAKQLAQVQAFEGTNIGEETGLTPFQIRLAKGRMGVYSIKNLIKLMKAVREAEKGIKVGTIDESIAVMYVLTQVWYS